MIVVGGLSEVKMVYIWVRNSGSDTHAIVMLFKERGLDYLQMSYRSGIKRNGGLLIHHKSPSSSALEARIIAFVLPAQSSRVH